MTAPITTLRTTIAEALAASVTTYSVTSFPRRTLTANSVTVMPADPYITPNNNHHISIAPMANFTILFAVPLLDNQGNLAGIEEMVQTAFTKLSQSGLTYNVSSISAPAELNADSGTLLTCEMQVSILTSWS